jgi:hypothetical protein
MMDFAYDIGFFTVSSAVQGVAVLSTLSGGPDGGLVVVVVLVDSILHLPNVLQIFSIV